MKKIPVYKFYKHKYGDELLVDDFVQLVNDHFREEHGTEFYADRLCITPNYLNKIVHQSEE